MAKAAGIVGKTRAFACSTLAGPVKSVLFFRKAGCLLEKGSKCFRKFGYIFFYENG
ncbi:hypothetical protein [Heyndrickxia coagulans]|uniref:hypothetical protein n=1 Tax=Heyndrickxia coagulans TaxID=1398 RepID=UPI00030F1835|nr:hypothetical protein [Heyndrickxia coagulans]